MDNIYDTLAKLNRVANRPEAKKIVKEDSHGMMKKGLRDLIDKSSKMNKQSTYKPFGKDDPDYETGLPKKKKDGFWLEVRNKGAKSGTILIRESHQAMMQAAKQYEMTKDVILMGEHKNGKRVDDKAKAKKAAKEA